MTFSHLLQFVALQAKLLKIPETVPFRLTQDVVDGFGVAGVEGVFRNCCEISLTVLKASKVREVFLALFEVATELLHAGVAADHYGCVSVRSAV